MLALGSFFERAGASLPFLTLAAALVAGVERVKLALFYENYPFHRAAKGPYRDLDQLEAVEF
jgi:hypothetical protein